MRLLSGIQPTGIVTLGNYLGAIKNFVELQNTTEDLDMLIFIADLHAITVPQNKTELRKNIKNLAAIYVACGLDPKKMHIFVQSEVIEHTYLGHIMECTSYIGELERMTQFKDKKQRQVEGVTVGLLTYPDLMAADIILYDADLVPVGIDQKQHLELTRNLAERFNNKYGETFKIPDGYYPKVGAKIMSLQDPLKKMSKSDPNPKGYINLLDNIDTIKARIKSAVTDSEGSIKYDLENKPGISNLMSIYSCITGLSYSDIESKYKDSNYQEFKADLAEVVANELKPIQERFNELVNSDEINKILDEGRDYASYLARRKIAKVNDRLGLGRKRK